LLPATASTKDDLGKTRPGTAQTSPGGEQTGESAFKDPVERFIESNVLETLYHEMGHALSDKMNLSVFGPEEFAADFCAAGHQIDSGSGQYLHHTNPHQR